MNDKHGGSLLEFFVGLLLLGAGLFMITNQVTVTSSFGMLRWGGFSVPFGLTTVPLIIGIFWLFVKPESMLPKIVIVLGALFIIAGIIMSVRLYFARTSLYAYILMFGMTAAGTGVILKTLFASKDKSQRDDKNKKE